MTARATAPIRSATTSGGTTAIGGIVEFSQVVRARHSVREFDGRSVDDEMLGYVLEAGRIAPSTGNRQSASFIVVRDPETIRVVGRPYVMYNKWLPYAPAIIVACGDKLRAQWHHGVEFWQVDGAIALEHMALAATDIGLATCWVGLFHPREVRRALGIPRRLNILAMLALGYPLDPTASGDAPGTKPHNRKPISDFAHWERW